MFFEVVPIFVSYFYVQILIIPSFPFFFIIFSFKFLRANESIRHFSLSNFLKPKIVIFFAATHTLSDLTQINNFKFHLCLSLKVWYSHGWKESLSLSLTHTHTHSHAHRSTNTRRTGWSLRLVSVDFYFLSTKTLQYSTFEWTDVCLLGSGSQPF